jgi:hypothetical protein
MAITQERAGEIGIDRDDLNVDLPGSVPAAPWR